MANPLMDAARGDTPCRLPGQKLPGEPVTLPARVVLPALDGVVNNPAFQVLEHMDTVMPNDAWYDVNRSPRSPTQFEILHYMVPRGKAVTILDFNFEVYKFSGAGPYAAEPVPEKSLNGVMGFVFLINNDIPGHTGFYLEPRPSNYERQQFRPPGTQLVPPNLRTVSDFQRTAASQYGSALGYGIGILPQRLGPFGPHGDPMAFFADEDMHIQMIGVVWRPVPVPIAFVRASFSGYSSSVMQMSKFLNDLQPAT